MALGNSSIIKLDGNIDKIKSDISFGNETNESVYSTWNTFQYVSNNLSLWADETTVGANVKQNLTQLSKALYSLMESTEKLRTRLDSFSSNQKNINGKSEANKINSITNSNYDRSRGYKAGDLTGAP